jgi:hypothetical protein
MRQAYRVGPHRGGIRLSWFSLRRRSSPAKLSSSTQPQIEHETYRLTAERLFLEAQALLRG